MIKTKIVPFTLDWEWLDGPAADPRDQATWARLRIAAGDQPVTLVSRLHEASSRTGPASATLSDTIEVALYPLAEWVAENWWSLVADARPGTMISQLRFAYKNGVADERAPWVQRSRRHVVRAAGGGYHWPDLLIVPEGRQTRMVWMPDGVGATGIRYLGTGNALLETVRFTARLAEFVDAVVARLDAAGLTGTELHATWHAIGSTDSQTAEFSRLVAQLGLDPAVDAAAYRDDVLDVVAGLPPRMVFDFFNGAGRNRLRERLDWVRRAQATIGTATIGTATIGTATIGTATIGTGPVAAGLPEPIRELRELCADLRELFYAPGGTEDPWDIGAETALRVRKWSGLGDTEPFDPAPFMHYEVQPTPYLDRGIVAAGSVQGWRGPTLVAARAFDDRPRRFLQCRALWHFICGAEDDFLIVAAHTHRQHIARGFALEVLAPATGIARRLGDPQHLVTAEDVEQIADDYVCGNIVVEHQLDNRVTALDFTWEPDRSVLAELAVRPAPVAPVAPVASGPTPGADSAASTFPWSPGPAGTPPPQYARLREREPVARVRLADDTPIWLATRYEDVHRVLTDPVFSRYRAATLPGAGLGRGQGGGIVDLDEPEHARYRAPVEAAFDVSRVLRRRGRIAAIAAEALEELAERASRPAGASPAAVDLVAGYTAPLAGRVTCELLGVAGAGWRQLTADVETQVLAGSLPAGQVESARERIIAVLTDLLARRREQPEDDVASTLLATAGDDGTADSLSDGERLTLLQGLVMSGFIGVRDLLARHLFAVLADPALAARLRADPAAVPAAVEELLRYYPSSNDGLLRLATRDVVLGGTPLPAGALVLPLVSAASRDPRQFPAPDRIDLDRDADRSIAFGAGPHACPAVDLARTELRIGISALMSRFPDVRLAVPAETVQHSSDLIPLGITELPVVLGPSRLPGDVGDRVSSKLGAHR